MGRPKSQPAARRKLRRGALSFLSSAAAALSGGGFFAFLDPPHYLCFWASLIAIRSPSPKEACAVLWRCNDGPLDRKRRCQPAAEGNGSGVGLAAPGPTPAKLDLREAMKFVLLVWVIGRRPLVAAKSPKGLGRARAAGLQQTRVTWIVRMN